MIGTGFLKARCEDERQELRLVADFRKGDNARGDEERFHEYSLAGLQTIDHIASPAKSEALWSKVLPSCGNRLRHDLLVKCVDVSHF